MPNQRENKVIVELTADEKQSLSLLAAVQAHLALLNEGIDNSGIIVVLVKWLKHSSDVSGWNSMCIWIQCW